MGNLDDKVAAIRSVFSKNQKLTGPDIQVFRENAEAFNHISSRKADDVRIQVELIDAIRSLDEASGKLITKTNWLTGVILALTVVGVGLGVIQVWIALRGPH